MSEPTTTTGREMWERLGRPSPEEAVAVERILAIEAEARAQERLRLLRLYTADALALGWTKDMLAAIRRRLEP